jgi:hypothetical protein
VAGGDEYRSIPDVVSVPADRDRRADRAVQQRLGDLRGGPYPVLDVAAGLLTDVHLDQFGDGHVGRRIRYPVGPDGGRVDAAESNGTIGGGTLRRPPST